jgi:hypothetical protein
MFRFDRSHKQYQKTTDKNNNNNNNKCSDSNIPKHKSELRAENRTKDQYLTLQDVCPVWFKRLNRGLAKDEKDTMARDSKYCLVGEAWGFTGRHAGFYIAPLIPLIGCWTCVKYGNKMGKTARNKPLSIKLHSTDFEPTIAEFMTHWNERHAEITNKLKNMKGKMNHN